MNTIGKILLVLLFMPIVCFANNAIRVPAYAHVLHPQCSCDCDDKIVYTPAKLSYKNLVTWAKEAATSVYTFGHGNYQFALQKASQYFTANGWREFAEALEKSGNLNLIVNKKLLVSAIVAGDIKSIKRVKIQGRDAWVISLPLLVKYESDSATARKSYQVKMTVLQGPRHLGVQGLGIEQFIVSDATSA